MSTQPFKGPIVLLSTEYIFEKNQISSENLTCTLLNNNVWGLRIHKSISDRHIITINM